MSPITLTKDERETVEWAFGAMDEYWGGECTSKGTPSETAEGITENDLTIPAGAAMPYLTPEGALVVSTWDEINDDLAYRVGTQAVQMLGEPIDAGEMSESTRRRRTTSYQNLAATIRGAI